MSIPRDPNTGLYPVKIDGMTFEFEKWGADEATDVALDIAGIVGGPLGGALASMYGGQGQGLSTEITADLGETVMRELTRNMREHKAMVKDVLMRLTSGRVHCDGQKIVYKDFYVDRLPLIFKVAKAGFEVQLGSFTAAVVGSGALASPAQGKPTTPASAT